MICVVPFLRIYFGAAIWKAFDHNPEASWAQNYLWVLYRFSIGVLVLTVMFPLNVPSQGRVSVLLQASISFCEDGDRLRCISGIESADTRSTKSVWP